MRQMLKTTPGTLRSALTVCAALAVFGAASTGFGQASGSDGDSAGTSSTSESTPEEEPDDEKSLRERVEYVLSGYHFSADRERLEGMAAASEIAATLREIADDTDARPSLRTRAVDMLALYPSGETSRLLESYLSPPSDDLSEERLQVYSVMRLHAISSVAEMYDEGRAVKALDASLRDENLQVRLMAVAALGKHAGEAGEARLREFADQTDHSEVLREIRKYVDLER